ncbi:MAG: hypothetical protein KIS78_11065 [Labilithrix sp.]|nr:hypothetical protein [Labilithrix sp.]MCW5832940.1 hypothetical protein [Labilithrix sp.]
MSAALAPISTVEELYVVQRKELAELFGYESRNKYEIRVGGQPWLYAAEQGKDLLGALMRQLLGHARTFEIHVFDMARTPVLRIVHPFRFWLQRLEVFGASGERIGEIRQRLSLFKKRFDVLDASGRVLLEVASPFWKPWTFTFQEGGQDRAVVQKKWSGLGRELFTDADTFRVGFHAGLSTPAKILVLAAALFVDLQYFERKAG